MEVNVVWWRLRTSNPSKGGNVLGEFDSHTPPPFFFESTRRARLRMKQEAIICFESVSNAIMAEQALTGDNFAVRVMPTPSSIRGGCGICLRFLPEDLERAAAFLFERGFTGTETYLWDGGENAAGN